MVSNSFLEIVTPFIYLFIFLRIKKNFFLGIVVVRLLKNHFFLPRQVNASED
jgi:hypothetical protein